MECITADVRRKYSDEHLSVEGRREGPALLVTKRARAFGAGLSMSSKWSHSLSTVIPNRSNGWRKHQSTNISNFRSCTGARVNKSYNHSVDRNLVAGGRATLYKPWKLAGEVGGLSTKCANALSNCASYYFLVAPTNPFGKTVSTQPANAVQTGCRRGLQTRSQGFPNRAHAHSLETDPLSHIGFIFVL